MPMNERIDANGLLRALRLPYWSFAALRSMRVGDSFTLFCFSGPPVFGLEGGEPSTASACIERVHGGLNLSALWMLHVGRAAGRRTHVFVPDLRIAVRPGREFELFRQSPSDNGLRLFTTVVRRVHRLADLAEASGAVDAAMDMRPSIRGYEKRPLGKRVPFLATIAGAPAMWGSTSNSAGV
jgi:hypothetical protein